MQLVSIFCLVEIRFIQFENFLMRITNIVIVSQLLWIHPLVIFKLNQNEASCFFLNPETNIFVFNIHNNIYNNRHTKIGHPPTKILQTPLESLLYLHGPPSFSVNSMTRVWIQLLSFLLQTNHRRVQNARACDVRTRECAG